LSPAPVAGDAGTTGLLARKGLSVRAASAGVGAVLASLVPAVKVVLRYIVDAARANTPHTADSLLAKCRANLTVSGGSQALKAMITELTDHEIVRVTDGAFVLSVDDDAIDEALK